MSIWARYPTLYGINTWIWLLELIRKLRKPVAFGPVDPCRAAVAGLSIDAVWLMGLGET